MSERTSGDNSTLQQICRGCGNDFAVGEAELKFLQGLAIKAGEELLGIPPPTLCPSCRLQRRMAHRNQIHVALTAVPGYERPIFSMHYGAPTFPILTNEDWWNEERWSPDSYGVDFDFSRPFFDQFAELQRRVPRPAVNAMLSENSQYCNNVGSLKNCYFVFDANTIEDSMYIETAYDLKDCLDCSVAYNSELCFDCLGIQRCYNLQSSDHCSDCSDSYFLLNCRSCKHCFGCVNLNRAEFCVFNEQLTKAQYREFLDGQRLQSHTGRAAIRERFEGFAANFPRPHLYGARCEAVTGNHVHSSRNVENSFFIENGERLRHCFAVSQGASDCQDLTIWGQNAELLYECLICGNNVFNLLFCFNCWNGASNLTYCDSCHGSSNLFGCIGMRRRRNCVLNRQYTEEQYAKLVPRIVAHMRATGEWGEFFPAKSSLAPYNLSLAQRYFPLTEPEAAGRDLSWHHPHLPAVPPGALPAGSLPDEIPAGDQAIVVLAGESRRPFRITTEELKRCRKFNVPLPREPYDQRMNIRMSRAGGLKLRPASCAKSGKALLTAHAEHVPYPIWDRELFEREMV